MKILFLPIMYSYHVGIPIDCRVDKKRALTQKNPLHLCKCNEKRLNADFRCQLKRTARAFYFQNLL